MCSHQRGQFRSFAFALSLLAVATPAGVEAAGPSTPKPPVPPAGPPSVDKPLLAYWAFDEPAGAECLDSSGNRYDAVPSRANNPAIGRVDGLTGGALELSGPHRLHVAKMPAVDKLEKIGLSAWVMPAKFDRYNEIFRKEDGDQRVLFSFQENGTILSLGLNVAGYVECDAKITPADVLDGLWHHCAATFDGRVMRVYLDGREIGSLERTGVITSGGPAHGCIGSSSGGECFQGVMDELRIYADALTPDEVTTLYRGSLEAATRQAKQLAVDLDTFFHEGATFAETLSATRKNLVEKGIRLDRKTAGLVMARLRARFAEEYGAFTQLTGSNPISYLTARGNDFHQRHVGRLVEMMLEYQPLTECQIAKQTPAERQRWAEAEAIAARFERLLAAGEASQYSPDWLDVMLEAGRRIEQRPRVSEPVAPYVTPSTPETRDLTADEARDALHRDWLHQAGGRVTPERIRQEIGWARELAERIEKKGVRTIFGDKNSSDPFSRIEEATAATQDAAALTDLYFAVRELKRSIQFANPVVDFDRVLLVDMPFPQGREWPHETRHRLGYQAVPGGRLLVLEGLSPSGHLRQLMPQAPLHGSFWRPDVSWDAKTVLFCFKPHNEKAFHLYEIGADGTGLRQLTDGIYDDFDPIYLPDGNIIFSTTRGHTYVRCMPPTNAYVLARCDADGRNVYLISRNNEPDYLPSVMNDGRVIYTRWEYTDKPLWRAQSLWTVNPDGTQVATFWGNQSVWPDLLKDARSIPGSRRVMFTGSAHHNWFSGSVGIIDPDGGFNFPNGLTKVTADVTWPESGNGPVDPVESPRYHPSGSYAAYYSPYPLSEQDFLVSANRGGKFVLYLMDVDGNRELVYEGVNNIFHAMPLRPRPRPPTIVDRVAWPTRQQREKPKPGVIYSSNVYHGVPPQLRGKAKYLRVLNIEHKTYTYWYKRPYLSTGPVVSGVQSEGVKRVLGTVPIEEDGSVAFRAPPGIPLHFQLLDENHRALQTMRSFTGVMPGEQRGCLGCHEMHSTTPQYEADALAMAELPGGAATVRRGSSDRAAPDTAATDARPSPVVTSLAMLEGPREITPPPWGLDSVSYPRYVRPVLEKYCAKCHTGDGEGRKKVDMTPRPGHLGFDETYWLLTGRPAWGRPYQKPENPPPGFGIADMIMVEGYDQRDPVAYQTPEPMTRLSYKSRLIELVSSGKHNDVKVDPVSLRRLILWVDTMCPYRGDVEVREIDDPEFQGVDWLSVRPKIKNAPRIIRPGPVD